jgi:hypothetical protein
MGVLFKRKGPEKDQTTNALINRGVYRIPEYTDDEEGRRLKGAKVAYSFWSSVRYTFILSLLLWWLPIFGQMIAGYVGGRRAGSPWRGVAAALIPVMIIFAIMAAIEAGWIPTVFFGIDFAPAALLGAIAAHLPLVEPYLNFTLMYFSSFLDAIQTTTSLRLDSYIITVAFAYIGGILSDQTRREMEYVSKSGGQKTTVVVEGTTNSPPVVASPVPSWSAHYLQPRRHRPVAMSFEDMTALGAQTYAGSELDRPIVPARRIIHQEEETGKITPRERELLRSRAQHMYKDQRKVEKKVHRKNRTHPTNRTGGIKGLVKRTTQPQAPMAPEEQSQRGSGDWEFI